jgi:hypothetical protein
VKQATIEPENRQSQSAEVAEAGKESPFFVPAFLHFLGGWVHRHPVFWRWLGRLESNLLADQIQQVPVHMPIYVAGLARSGSTLLHEIVCSHPHVATLRSKDYPMLFTPYWWRRATANMRPQPPRERPHRDGMMVTPDSPDALEEMVWMAFFSGCHDPSVSNLMGADDSHASFEAFYNFHIRKLLLAERATRYAAKANYHVARLSYLIRLFPNARFVIPVRAPATHVESLLRQHDWFSRGQRQYPRALAFMRRSGHFEFGLDRRPMNLGDGERVRRILQAWADGEEVRGLAMYWRMVYEYLADLLDSNAAVRDATLVVRFEELCASPAETLRAVFRHCALPDAEHIVERHAPGIHAPTYYQSRLPPDDLAVIRSETCGTAGRWGF